MITWMQTHRKYLVVTIWISTIAFVGAGFVGWGAYSYGGNKGDTVAKVGDREISVNELQNTYSNVYGYYNQLFGGKLTKEKASQMHLQEIALEKLTNEALLLNYADSLGITALKDEVINEYTSIKAFQENGVFNKERYKQILRGQGINEKTFEHELEKSVILKKLNTALNLPVTPLEKAAMTAATSLADHLVVKKITQSLEDVTLDDAEIKKYWESHKTDYMSKISYVLETITVQSGDLNVSDADVTAYYNEKKYKFKDSAGKILPFEQAKGDVIKAVQQKAAKTAVLKKYLAFKKGEIKAEKKEVVDAASSTFPVAALKDKKAGDYLKAVALPNGYLTAHIETVNKPKPLPFEDARKIVEMKLRQDKAITLLEAKAKKESTALQDGEDLGFVTPADSAKIKGLKPQEASQFLQYLFSKEDKKGYFILANNALVYNITEQTFSNQETNASKMENIVKNLTAMKANAIQSGLIKELKKKYKIKRFIKEG